jgi:basic amino acid/polyamine antiporter, APA family
MPPVRQSPSDSALVRAIGVRGLAAAIVNGTVGSGIFVLPALVAATLGPASILAYVVCTVAAGLVALCFAEAGSRVSASGGIYAYVETAFGPYAGFVTGVLFWFGSQMIASAAVATLLVTSVAALVPALDGPVPRAAMLVALYAGLAAVNIRGVRSGLRLVELVTLAKLAPLLLLVVAGSFFVEPQHLAWTGLPSVGDLGAASLVLVFAFTGMEGVVTSSGEVKNPARTVPRAVFLGLAVVAVLYGSVQLVTQGILGPALAQNSGTPLAAAAERAFGGWGRALLLVGATISTFGFLSGDMLATPRVLFAFSRDGLLPAGVGAVHARFRTPYMAITIHGIASCAFALLGTFRALAVISVVAALLLYLACALAVLELRRRDVRTDGSPFQAPGGPAVPLLAICVVLWMLSSATRTEFLSAGAVIAVASMLYLLRRRRPERPEGSTPGARSAHEAPKVAGATEVSGS